MGSGIIRGRFADYRLSLADEQYFRNHQTRDSTFGLVLDVISDMGALYVDYGVAGGSSRARFVVRRVEARLPILCIRVTSL